MKRIEIRDTEFYLLPEHAVYWPAEAVLLITDPHFGKAAAFRAAGVAVPGGTTMRDLRRLAELIEQWRPRRLIVLGDLVHAEEGLQPEVLARVAHWRSCFPELQVELVSGNHDAKSGEIPGEFALNAIHDRLAVGPFELRHHPEPDHGRYVIAGHVHPAVSLRDFGGFKQRFPCFYFGRDYAVLPAFGSFTGTGLIQPERGDRVFVAVEQRVVQIPTD